MSSALKKFIWPLVAEMAEEQAKAIVEDFVREMNEEVRQYIEGEGSQELDKILDDLPEEFQAIVRSMVIEYVKAAVTPSIQKAVDKAWVEVERINKGDVADPAPKVNFSE